MSDMSNEETANHLRNWVKNGHGVFAWPTDACGYDQHIKFVKHRNSNWNGTTTEEFNKFVLDYADSLPPTPKNKEET